LVVDHRLRETPNACQLRPARMLWDEGVAIGTVMIAAKADFIPL
jgi:hypothetical protein